jgi:hypothetical protein
VTEQESVVQIGYCGNVHPGRTLAEVKRNLTEHSLAVKQLVSADSVMGIGLWLSATTANELLVGDEAARFGDWLARRGLLPFTLNGFPFGDFHQSVVKHSVYRPTWAEKSRLDYTVNLARIHHQLLPPNSPGTISTLPLGWPANSDPLLNAAFFQACARNLKTCAEKLSQLEQETGRQVTVCVEPEPGCLLETCGDVVDFFSCRLRNGDQRENERIQRYLGVCHDVCHSAVMFEDQSTAIAAYTEADIQIGKIQVSSAIQLDFDSKTVEQQRLMCEQLALFSEPRYLHQTSVKIDDSLLFYEDLPAAMSAFGAAARGQWRVHFHVPIYASNLGLIETSQHEIGNCLAALRQNNAKTTHFEIETYAWNVLPIELSEPSLSIGIAKEIDWFVGSDAYVKSAWDVAG